MTTVQLLVQRVTNGIIVSPVPAGGTSVDLSQLAVFAAADHTLLKHLQDALNMPVTLPEAVETVREVRAIIEEQSAVMLPKPRRGPPDEALNRYMSECIQYAELLGIAPPRPTEGESGNEYGYGCIGRVEAYPYD